MNIDDVTLIHYLDKHLSDEENQLIEQMMKTDEDLRQRIEALKASMLPYQAAFAQEPIPEMPNHLHDKLNEIGELLDDDRPLPSKHSFSLAWVASFLLVAFLAGFLTKHWFALPTDTSLATHETLPIDETLLQAMIQYQALYTRDTVKHASQKQQTTEEVLTQFFGDGASAFNIPNLQTAGYQFRRAQLLSHQGEAILQLVYLPEQGEPLALCITKTTTNDPALHTKALNYPYAGINSLVWTDDNMTMMLMHNASIESLHQLHQVMKKT